MKPNPELIDAENPEWTEQMFKESVRTDALPELLKVKLRGRAKATSTKERITIHLSQDVLQAFRATGDGWQTRIDEALQEWVQTHRPK